MIYCTRRSNDICLAGLLLHATIGYSKSGDWLRVMGRRIRPAMFIGSFGRTQQTRSNLPKGNRGHRLCVIDLASCFYIVFSIKVGYFSRTHILLMKLIYFTGHNQSKMKSISGDHARHLRKYTCHLMEESYIPR